MRTILLAAIRPLRAVDLEGLDEALRKTFGAPVSLGESPIDVAEAYDSAYRQYDGAKLLTRLLERAPRDAYRILGVTTVDLFAPAFEYLFGEAQLDGVGAVLSTHRLRSELYGLPPDPDLLAERIIKEAVHELGLTFGLVHCFNPVCVMNPSTFIEQIDAKSRDFCRQCDATMRESRDRD